MNLAFSELTKSIIRSYYTVYNSLGYGFLEKVYEKSMLIELRKAGLSCVSQYPIIVLYDGAIVGDYFADILVENQIIRELKAHRTICPDHEAQLLNYLKATEFELGLLMNFGVEPEFTRKIYTNNKK